MCLAEHMLSVCQDFIESVTEKERARNEDVQSAIEDLESLIADHIDGTRSSDDLLLIEAVAEYVDEVWDCASESERQTNSWFQECYQNLQVELQDLYNRIEMYGEFES